MKRHRRFSKTHSNGPILFFVSSFVFGTLLLVAVFVVTNRGSDRVHESSEGPSEQSSVEAEIEVKQIEPQEPLVRSPSEQEYQNRIFDLLTAYERDGIDIVGVPLEQPAWEQQVSDPSILENLKERTTELQLALLEERVPSTKRSQHLVYVLTAEDLMEALEAGRIEAVEQNFLRIEEFRSQIQE